MNNGSCRVFGLDVVRALAILMVLISHAIRFAPISAGIKESAQFAFGFYGVELFFILSGFLIGRILLRISERTHGFKDFALFWMRRALRTLPAYYTMLIVAPIVHIVCFGGTNLTLFEVAPYFLFLQNVYSSHPEFFGVAWSLSVEEWFYIIYPAILLWVMMLFKGMRGHQTVFISLMAMLLLGIVMRTCSTTISGPVEWDAGIRKVVLFRLDAIVYGVLIAWLLNNMESVRKYRLLMLALGIFFIGLSVLMLSYGGPSWGGINFVSTNLIFPITGIGIGLVVPVFFFWTSSLTAKWQRAVVFLSTVSYSLYLVHSLVWEVFLNVIPAESSAAMMWFTFAGYIILSFIATLVLHFLVERPILRLRERILSSQ